MRFSFYYWPLPFRGNFVRELFAFSGVAFADIFDSEEIRRMKGVPVDEQPVPFMGPPILIDHERDISLSQATAIVVYVAEELQLMEPTTISRAKLGKIMGDAMDVLSDITRANGSQMWDQESWKSFVTMRLPKWLRIFESSVDDVPELNASDIVCHALFSTMERCLPEISSTLRLHAPKVLGLCDHVGENAGLKTLVASQKERWGGLYCGGNIEESIRKMVALGGTGNA